jgi:hypothetical protein
MDTTRLKAGVDRLQNSLRYITLTEDISSPNHADIELGDTASQTTDPIQEHLNGVLGVASVIQTSGVA